MSRVNGIQCNWFGKTENLPSDQAVHPTWSRLRLVSAGPPSAYDDDLCTNCTQAATFALARAKKQMETGRTQR